MLWVKTRYYLAHTVETFCGCAPAFLCPLSSLLATLSCQRPPHLLFLHPPATKTQTKAQQMSTSSCHDIERSTTWAMSHLTRERVRRRHNLFTNPSRSPAGFCIILTLSCMSPHYNIYWYCEIHDKLGWVSLIVFSSQGAHTQQKRWYPNILIEIGHK